MKEISNNKLEEQKKEYESQKKKKYEEIEKKLK